MNVDELMSDVPSDAGPSSHGHVATKNGNGTPSGSGDDAPTWNTKKFRDECLNIRSRMLDSNFSLKEFPDPLLPRQPPLRKPLSDESADTIRQLKELVGEIRAEQARG